MMKFKKIVAITLGVAFLSGTSMFAKEKRILSGSDPMTEMQRFYYDLGKKEGKIEGVKTGYATALKDFKKLLKRYNRKVKAHEAAKYLMKNGKITYPKIYKVKEGNSYRIVIKPSTVESEFTAEDLFLIPLMDEYNGLGEEGEYSNGKPHLDLDNLISSNDAGYPLKKKRTHKNRNAFDLPDIESADRYIRPNSLGGIKSRVTLYIPYKSSSIKSFLHDYGLKKYSETKKGYIITFASAHDKQRFCRELTGESSCQRLIEKAM